MCIRDSLGRMVQSLGVPSVLCWRTRVQDDVARLFAKSFLEAVVHGHGYRRAYHEAVNSLRMLTHPTRSSQMQNGCVYKPLYMLVDPDTPREDGSTSDTIIYRCTQPRCPFRCVELDWQLFSASTTEAHVTLPISVGMPILLDDGDVITPDGF